MDRLQGLLGIVLILGIAVLASNNRRKIDLRLVGTGIGLQAAIAVLIFKVGPVASFFSWLGKGMEKLLCCMLGRLDHIGEEDAFKELICVS